MNSYKIVILNMLLILLTAPGDQGYDSAYSACLQSIDNLGCEYLDLYLIHWPAASKLKREDPKNLEYRSQSWKALEKLQNEGDVPIYLICINYCVFDKVSLKISIVFH